MQRVKLFLSFNVSACRVPGCDRQARGFGVCPEHEAEQVRLAFEYYVGEGLCHTERPTCFDSDAQWREYAVVSHVAYANQGGKPADRQLARVNYCRDCSPEFKRKREIEGRCGHPETVFVRRETAETIGVSIDWDRRSFAAWEAAMMGSSGQIIAMPSSHVIGETMERIAAGPRRRGRPPKRRDID